MRATVLLLLLTCACRVEWGPPPVPVQAEGAPPTGEVWIYTSVYQEVQDAMDRELRAAYPGLEPMWFRAGSEKVAQRVEAELAAGGSPACVLLTSDPFWYVELDERALLQPYLSPRVLEIDRALVDGQGAWVTARLSVLVLAANSKEIPEDQRPTRVTDLADPRFAPRAAMPDPLASGTALYGFARMDAEQGPEFWANARTAGLLLGGGNSAVLARVESGERPIGLLLYENLLAASRSGSPAVAILPDDGAIVVPGPVAIPKGCPNPAGARAVVDYLLSDAGQRAIVAGEMYPVLDGIDPPVGAPPLSALKLRETPPGFFSAVVADKAALKSRASAP